jgi:orotate phosphoribosyltransferase
LIILVLGSMACVPAPDWARVVECGGDMRRHRLQVHVAELAPVLLEAYDRAIYESFERTYVRRGNDQGRSRWALDLRKPLSHGAILAPIARELAAGLEEAGITQVAGFGFGAYPLVGAVVAVSPSLTGGLVRPAAKEYGFGERVEGDLDPGLPVALVDDLLGTGRAALSAAKLLGAQGFEVSEVHTVFAFAFRSGTTVLGQAGIAQRCLATLSAEPAFQVPRELSQR